MPRNSKKTIKDNPLASLGGDRVIDSKVQKSAVKVVSGSSKVSRSAKENTEKRQQNKSLTQGLSALKSMEKVKMTNQNSQAEEILNDEVRADGSPRDSENFRKLLAKEKVSHWAQWSVAAGFIPVPFVDTAAISGLQMKMIYDLCKVYDVPFKKELVSSILSSLVGGGATTFASQKVSEAVLSKVPYVGTVISTVTQPAIAYATTYAIGITFVNHFETNGNLLSFELDSANKVFKEQYEKAKSFSGEQLKKAKDFSETQYKKAASVFTKKKNVASETVVVDEAVTS